MALPAITFASKALTTTANLDDGDTITVGDVTYRAKTTMAQADDFKLNGSSAATTLSNLAAAINGSGTEGTEYFAGTSASAYARAISVTGTATVAVLTVMALDPGVLGNLVPIAEVSTKCAWAAGATVLGGGAESVNAFVDELRASRQLNADVVQALSAFTRAVD